MRQHQPNILSLHSFKPLRTMPRTAAQPKPRNATFPQQIRVSTGSAIVLGLLEGKLDAEPTTAYLMTYHAGKCTANCGFCPQARTSESKAELLSRVAWPAFSTRTVLGQLMKAVREKRIRRVCVQALNYPEAISQVCAFVSALKRQVSVPVSVSCQPLNSENMWRLVEACADRIGIALDAATERLFDRVKGASAGGPYKWQDELLLLRVAVGIFGEGNVSTHLIVGLGETEKEATVAVQECVDLGVLPALFAFTPVRGTALARNPQPMLDMYRRVQVARHIIVNGLARIEDMRFDGEGRLDDFGVSEPMLLSVVDSGNPFLTSGCPSCNRPFYNEKPGGPLYNYPRAIRPGELKAIKRDLKL
jgi:biotin synthase-related radical SAM superfamily protein